MFRIVVDPVYPPSEETYQYKETPPMEENNFEVIYCEKECIGSQKPKNDRRKFNEGIYPIFETSLPLKHVRQPIISQSTLI
mmetsp:Transcript_22545/g.19532  ORF Transcript_22545/g.19532 Transcript_22545/m.19532 type:complete len:81 (+) Transcript_22545:403-645(+)